MYVESPDFIPLILPDLIPGLAPGVVLLGALIVLLVHMAWKVINGLKRSDREGEERGGGEREGEGHKKDPRKARARIDI
jgi:hypothetical protein